MTIRDDGSPRRLIDEPLVRVGPPKGMVVGTKGSIAEIVASRQLLRLLVRRELRAKYKNSSLGFLWSLMRPLAQLVIYYVAIGQFLGAARNIPDFAIFVYTGLTIWTLFSEIIQSGTVSVIHNAGIVKKVYLPREIFPLSAVGGALVNFLIQFAILVAATIVLGRPPLHPDLLLAPAAIVLIVVFGTGCALLLSAINVYLRDIEHLVDVVMLVLFWASPTVYAYRYVDDAVGHTVLDQVYLANPVTLAVIAMQKAMWIAGSAPGAGQVWPEGLQIRLLVAFIASLILLWVGQRVFSRLQGNFAQEL